MTDNRRRVAADARRLAGKAGLESSDELRAVLRRNYDRGREDGRREVLVEQASMDGRKLALQLAADHLASVSDHLSSMKNARRSLIAVNECVAILRDAAESGESPQELAEVI